MNVKFFMEKTVSDDLTVSLESSDGSVRMLNLPRQRLMDTIPEIFEKISDQLDRAGHQIRRTDKGNLIAILPEFPGNPRSLIRFFAPYLRGN